MSRASPAAPKRFDEFEIFRLAESSTVDSLDRLRHVLESGEVDPNVRDPDRGMTPLHYAANKGNLEAIEILIDAGADVNAQNKRGRTPLHSLIEQKYDKVVLWLVQYCGANPHIADLRNIAPIDLALNWFQKEILDAFEARGQLAEAQHDDEEDAEDADDAAQADLDDLEDDSYLREASKTGKGATGGSGSSATKEPPGTEILKIVLPNGSYKSIRVGKNDFAEQVCETLADKLDLPRSYGKYFTMWEKIRERERKLNPGEVLFEARKNWPLIFGETGNETNKHCHFFVSVALNAPEKLKVMTGVKSN